MANGKSIIVSDKCGCAKNLVFQNINGFVFQSQNSNELTKKLIEMVKLKSTDNKMGKASLEIIKDFSFEKIAKVIENHLMVNSLN